MIKKCRDCKYWSRVDTIQGQCRIARPPWPMTKAGDWCGEWEKASTEVKLDWLARLSAGEREQIQLMYKASDTGVVLFQDYLDMTDMVDPDHPLVQQALSYLATHPEDGPVLSDVRLAMLNAPGWRVGESVRPGDFRWFEFVLYECVQAHTTQADWTPPRTPALWKVKSTDEIPLWIQPTGAHDAYVLGDKVIWPEGGPIWECTGVDANGYNSWEPGVYGWTQV